MAQLYRASDDVNSVKSNMDVSEPKWVKYDNI